jgi:hypothetical protein
MKTQHQVTINGECITITITQVITRYAPIYVPKNDYGEPVVVVKGFGSEEEALREEIKSLTTMLS